MTYYAPNIIQTMKIKNVNNLILGITGFCETFVPNSVYTQCIRWKRKPIWMPTAKSKVFRIPKKPVISVEEHLETQRLYNNYRTYITSLRAYLAKVAKENEVQFDQAAIEQAEEEDFQTCSAINDEWNAEVAKIREVRLANMREKRRESILQKLLQQEKQEEEQRNYIDEQIRQIKMEAVTFITAENVDAAIEECLTNIVDHNRALDLEGNWYDGEYSPKNVPPLEETQKPAIVEN
ncbi:probable 28S ribosomal protein S26, mitochondrial [Cataglyphis hispanica]|uniref:probable 28S ribosomal protein S26, mitochondrial n=1 Tax=Cataglyphis hispanica TaxID=1086592 RepID=UPI00217F8334|nr:probable 28S ribosomal protein S26, mitochondrial [Cataglyphis hispanica]